MILASDSTRFRASDLIRCPILDLAPRKHCIADFSREKVSLQRNQDMVWL